MKIVFITGSLAPGIDGVGDHTRALAHACLRHGHKVRLLSISEPNVPDSSSNIPDELRLTRQRWLAHQSAESRRWITEFEPDWVSLQFVPYSYHPYGIFHSSVKPLTKLLSTVNRARRHVYFHEIWIGSHTGATMKERGLGGAQRWCTRRLLHQLKPDVIHTSNEYYRSELNRLGWPTGRLRMFGNIPVQEAPPSFVLPDIPSDALVCGHFGTLHPNWQPEPWLSDFAELASKLGRPPVFISVGALGRGFETFAKLQAKEQGRIKFVCLGKKTNVELSQIFRHFDFALTSMPWVTVGKSGSAAALREHGLNVVVTAEGGGPRMGLSAEPEAESYDGFIPYFRDRRCLEQAMVKPPPFQGVDRTAESFFTELSHHG